VIDRKACFLSLLAQAPVWLLELRVSQHFSTFYEPSVQAMDIQLGARHRRWTPAIHRAAQGRGRPRKLGGGNPTSGVGPEGGEPPRPCWVVTALNECGMRNGELNSLIPHSESHAPKRQDRSVRGNTRSGFSQRTTSAGSWFGQWSGDPARTTATNPIGKKTRVNRNFAACQSRSRSLDS